MSRWVLVLWIALLLGAASPAVAQEPDIADRLRAVPGLTVVSDTAVANSGRFFVLTFRQPADHVRPWLGSFEQRLHLLYYAADRPTLLHTTGYNARTAQTPVELTRLIGGNQLNVEHRFFLPSRPDPANWTKLDIWQAATDHHPIVRALRPVLRGNWLSSGGSKGGMATVYHRRSTRGTSTARSRSSPPTTSTIARTRPTTASSNASAPTRRAASGSRPSRSRRSAAAARSSSHA
jgi:hypothetical protein